MQVDMRVAPDSIEIELIPTNPIDVAVLEAASKDDGCQTVIVRRAGGAIVLRKARILSQDV